MDSADGVYRTDGNAVASHPAQSGLYKLIMRSDKPEARPFQDWVAREVLPEDTREQRKSLQLSAVAPGPFDGVFNRLAAPPRASVRRSGAARRAG